MVPHKTANVLQSAHYVRDGLSKCDESLTSGFDRLSVVVPKKCGGTRFHRHRQRSGGVERCRDVPQQAPPHSCADSDHRPALPYAKPPLSKAYLCGREAKLDLHSPGWFVRNDVELIRGITVDHINVARQGLR